MKTMLIFLAIAALPAVSLGQTDIRASDFDYFKEVVQLSGYTCDSCDGGHALGSGYKGMLFRVYCNDNSLKYRVVIGKNYICAEPWDTKNQKCE